MEMEHYVVARERVIFGAIRRIIIGILVVKKRRSNGVEVQRGKKRVATSLRQTGGSRLD
jgi:hypothetical protein